MARDYGLVRVAFWQDGRLKGLSCEAKLCALFLLTASRADRPIISRRDVLAATGVSPVSLDELAVHGFVSFDIMGGVVFLDLFGFGTAPTVDGARPSASIWQKVRDFVFRRDNYTCVYCGASDRILEADHVIPVVKGGLHDADNVVTACLPCNRSKRDKTLAEWNVVRGAHQDH